MNRSLNFDVLLDLELLEPYIPSLFYEKEEEKNLILWPLLTITTFMTHIQTNGHGDSMTDPAQRTKLLKIRSPFQNG